MADTILVVDCGAQYGHLIARAIRRLNVFSELVSIEDLGQKISEHKKGLKGIIISGGPSSVYEENSPRPFTALGAGVPVLGICYGHQFIAHATGGVVERGVKKEYGPAEIRALNKGSLLAGLGDEEKVWMSHGDLVTSLPEGFEIYASSSNCPVASFGSLSKGLYGLQFHPEVAHTPCGEMILRNFAYKICRASPNWTMDDFVRKAIDDIKQKSAGKKVLLALSGGVDSSTAAALGSRAIGKNLVAVYIDTGLMRFGETEEVRKIFTKDFPVEFRVVDSSKEFLSALRGISDPEQKRKIIGDLFAKVFDSVMKEENADFLMQGTIYPDRIESAQASGKAAVIKTHHNVGSPLIMDFRSKGRVIEPLADLYKDEVREVAEKLGMPSALVWRRPFPGPGLAVRIEGDVTDEKIDIVKKADAIVREEIEQSLEIKERPWQYFAVLTNSKATGVKGDARAHGHVVAVRAVESREAMTASFSRLSYDLLERISTRITNEVPAVSHVVYSVTPKPPATIEWE